MINFIKNKNSIWKKVAGILLFYILFSATITIFAAPPTTKYLPGDTLDPNCAPGDANCTVAVESAVVNFTTIDDTDSPYSVLATDQVIYADTSSGDVEVSLPSISSVSEKRTIIVLKTAEENTVNISASSGDFINETTAIYVTDNKRAIRIESIKANQWLAVPNFQELPVPAILVKAGTVSNLDATYDNGTSGVGATLTASPAASLPTVNFNGLTLSVGERVLVKSQSDAIENGVYEVTQTTSPWILTRTTDADETSEMEPQIVIATQGTSLIKGKQFSQLTPSPTLGTSNISYSNIIPSVQGLLSQQTTGTQVSGQIPFWTSTARQLSKGSSALFWDDVNKRLGINDGTPDAFLDIESNSASGDLLAINGGTPSGNGNGGGISIVLGNANALNNSGQSFAGGSFSLVAGNGDVDTVSTDPGHGGSISFTTGNSTSGDFGLGQTGNGGDFNISTGVGSSSGGTDDGGNGGSIVFALGDGAEGAAGGNGGSFSVTGGDGSGGLTGGGGNGGDVFLDGGQAGVGTPSGRAGIIFLGQTRGRVAIGPGITSTDRLLEVRGDLDTEYVTSFFNDGNDTNRYGILVQAGLDNQASAGPSTLVQFNDGDGTSVGSITFGSNTTSYNTSSDERLKENIVNTSLTLEDLMEIRIRDFTWIADSEEKLAHGVIAQELFEVYPGAVTVPVEDDRYWMVDYSKLTPLVIKSVQDLNLKVDSLSASSTSSGVSIESVISYLQDSAQKTINGVVTFFEIITEKITTKKLCVEDVCVTKDEFLDLLEQNNITPVPAEDVEEQIPAEEILEPQEELPDEQIEIPIEETPEEIIEEPESVVIQEEQIETAEPSL